ncbi:hypothetical protein F2Q68_00022419 [Brassica cretica]|uniref:RRM domain-containing protein n=1 Tax=Brassica cretica TaxID=69181 RepID=A0A8S9G303_BRACR|nr:hypothetical protein F2Q68_00022419 [Brassica cretica]
MCGFSMISELFYNYGSFWRITYWLLLWFREPGGFGFVKYRYAEDAAKAMKLKKRHWPQKLKSVYFLFDSGTGLEVCQGHVLGPSVADLAIQVEREKRFSSFAMDVHLCAYFVLII